VQRLSSEIKLRIRTAPVRLYILTSHRVGPGQDRRRNPNLNNSSDWGRPVAGSDTGWAMGLAGHVTFGWECLRHLSWSEMQWQRQRWTQGHGRRVVDDPSHICTGTAGGNPTIIGLGVVCPNRRRSRYEGSCGAQGQAWVLYRQ